MLVNTMFVKWLQLSTLLSCCVFVREFNSSVVIKLFLLLGEPKIDFSARHVRTSRTVSRAHETKSPGYRTANRNGVSNVK